MMIIQVVLIVGVVLLLILFLRRQSRHQLSAWSKILVILFVCIAIFVVLFPDSSNTVAHFVGVSRGADLLLYMLTLLVIFQMLNNYTTHKREQQRVVGLARKIALLEAKPHSHITKKRNNSAKTAK